MKRREWILAAASFAGAALLLVFAVKAGKLQPAVTLSEVRHAAPVPLVLLLLLTAAHIFLSTQKWRSVDAVLRAPVDAIPSRRTSFGMTAFGVALGQVLPIQVGVVTGRTMGSRFFGRPFRRGTLGSVFEQGFDVLVMLLLAIASGFTVLVRGDAVTWIIASGVMLGFGLVAVGPLVRWTKRLGTSAHAARLLGRRLSDGSRHLCDAGLLDPALARRLTLLSVARFSVQVLMAAEVCAAIGVHIPIWHLAASVPLVILACVLVVTPGGIGIGELSYAGVLHLFGTPVSAAVQWAVAARILISGSCFVVAASAVIACAATGTRQKATRIACQTAYEVDALQGLHSE